MLPTQLDGSLIDSHNVGGVGGLLIFGVLALGTYNGIGALYRGQWYH